jgi:hypothetical protein
MLHGEELRVELEPLRRKAARWAADHRERLGHATPRTPEGLHDRAQDLWRPLAAIAGEAGGDWPDRAYRAALELAGVQTSDNRLGVQLLARIQSLFETRRTDRLSSETIIRALADAQDPPSPDHLPLTQAQLARRLTPFGIRPTIVHRTRTQVRRGYRLADFRDAFRRYVANESPP